MHRVTSRCTDGARLRSCPPTTRQDTSRAVHFSVLIWKVCVDQSVFFAVPLWPIHRRRRRDRPRNSQAVRILLALLPLSIMTADCRNVDHRPHYREHIHVPPAAHSDRHAFAGPILLPLPPKVGILSQGNAPSPPF